MVYPILYVQLILQIILLMTQYIRCKAMADKGSIDSLNSIMVPHNASSIYKDENKLDFLKS